MIAAPDVPPYRLYTSCQAGERAGLSGRTFARLARQGAVEHTRVGRLVFWTDEQIRGAVDYLAVAVADAPAKSATPRPRADAPASPPPRNVVELKSKPGRRYAADAFTS